MLWGNAPLNEDSTNSYDLWEYQAEQDVMPRLEKILVPKASKAQIRTELEEIYGISKQSLYLVGGYLETQFRERFGTLKDDVWLKTIYISASTQLTDAQRRKAKSMFGNCESMFGGCISIGKNT